MRVSFGWLKFVVPDDPDSGVVDSLDGGLVTGIGWEDEGFEAHDGLHHMAPDQVNKELLKSGKTLCYSDSICPLR